MEIVVDAKVTGSPEGSPLQRGRERDREREERKRKIDRVRVRKEIERQ